MILSGTPLALKLIDFGVAKHEFTSVHTMDGSVFGKPPYMAPELCAGEAVDERTDLYALGILFYLLLTGSTPFADRNPLVVMRMHETAPVPPLPTHIPTDIQRLVNSLLEKRRSDRLGSAEMLIERIAPINV